jgi:hypothetical protein
MTVGELANVRHPAALMDPADQPIPDFTEYSPYRTDGRVNDATATTTPGPDYVSAIALLVALGDWVTVRSHVFTVYGVVRGQGDPSIVDDFARAADVDRRAIRFQETVDRLPIFRGDRGPARVGERIVGPYTDVRND